MTKGNENAPMPDMPPDTIVSALRFTSVPDSKRPESRILNYKMKDMLYISKIKVPTLAVLGDTDYFMNITGISATLRLTNYKKIVNS